MGGDHGPHVTVPAALALQGRHRGVELALGGLAAAPAEGPRARGAAAGPRLRLQPASERAGMDEPAAQARRCKTDSSMRGAVSLVRSGAAHACVSAGNTGALMAISRFVL